DGLCLEFQVADGLFQAIKGGVRQVRVPYPDLQSVTLTKGWLGTTWLGVRVVIQAGRVDAFRGVHGATQGRVELAIARADVTAAEGVDAAVRFNAAQAECVRLLPPDRQEAEEVLATSAAYACGYNRLFPLLTGERAYATDRPLRFVFVPPAPAPGG